MGCSGSSARSGAPPPPGVHRRRLSVDRVDESGGANDTDVSEEDRGLISSLNAQNVIEMLQNNGDGRKFSIGSETDEQKTSFMNKQTKQIGSEVDEKKSGLGYTCRKGLKPESPNQDSWFILQVDNDFSIYGVFDGHGHKGHDVSNFVKDNLPKLIIRDQRFKTKDMGAMLFDSFKKTQSLINTMDRTKKLNAQMSGTTASVVVHNHSEKKLFVSHVADSTVVLGSWEDSSQVKCKAKQLTRDHKPNLKDERARIEKAGGRVIFDGYTNHRVYAKNGRYPGLNMSRCLGDLLGHQDAGCSCEPEVSTHELTDLDHMLLLCSDGVWEFMTPQEAVDFMKGVNAGNAMQMAEKLAKEAWDRWIQEEGGAVVDDITVVVVLLKP